LDVHDLDSLRRARRTVLNGGFGLRAPFGGIAAHRPLRTVGKPDIDVWGSEEGEGFCNEGMGQNSGHGFLWVIVSRPCVVLCSRCG
jgi:hypothetical protein